jgi:diguanylate cyclase (GGDEF)-like protein
VDGTRARARCLAQRTFPITVRREEEGLDSTETAVAVVSACAAVLALALALLAVRTVRTRSDRRFEAVLARLDGHLGMISASLERVVERAESMRARGVDDLELTVDLDELLRRVAVEAATRTGANAAAVQVLGPGGEPRTAAFGDVPGTQALDTPLASAAGTFRAVTINWAYRPEAAVPDPITSALVVPVLEHGRETGSLAAYAPGAGAFGPDHVEALESLAAEVGPLLATARSIAEAQRELTDTVTGLRSQAGYDVELERAVSRARETGRPLSLLILSRADLPEREPARAVETDAEAVLRELASLLVNATRATDIVCRRRDEQFGIVLPDTAADPARSLYRRLLDAAAQASFQTARQLTFAAGLVEWRPDESSEALDSRALAAVGRTRTEQLALGGAREEPGTFEPTPRSAFVERLRRELDRARHMERPLALLVAQVDGIQRIADAHGTTAAERVLEEVEARLAEILGGGEVGAHLSDDGLGVILFGSGSTRAESVFSALQAALDRDPATHLDRLGVSAGITVLAASDDAASVLERAERAVERATRTGAGTVVVAMSGDGA